MGATLYGDLFLAGIAVNDRRGVLYALWGALLPLGMAFFADDYTAFNTGLFGYNGVLCAIALAGPSAGDFARATCAVLLSIALQWLGMQAGSHPDRTLRHGHMDRDGGRGNHPSRDGFA